MTWWHVMIVIEKAEKWQKSDEVLYNFIRQKIQKSKNTNAEIKAVTNNPVI